MSKRTEAGFNDAIGKRYPEFVKQHLGLVYGAMTE
jgi:hypothetical protein